MRKLTTSALLLLSLVGFAQNEQVQNPPDDQVINAPAQLVMNTNYPHNINDDVNLANEPKNKQVKQQQQINWNLGNVFAPNESDQGYHPPRQKWGQSIQLSSDGYSGSSGSSAGTKHKSKTSSELKFKKALKIFEHKYRAPNHYGHKGRVRKCSQF